MRDTRSGESSACARPVLTQCRSEYLEVEITPPNERVHQMVDVVLKHVNAVLRKLRSVFLVEDIIDSLKFVVLFWVLTYIGAWFNGLTLVILSYLSAFSLPIVYEDAQDSD